MRTLLIDGDVVAYQAALAVEKVIEWEEGEFSVHASLPEAITIVNDRIQDFREALAADAHKIALTDSPGNFRKNILPTYKANRTRKPMILKQVIAYMIETLDAVLIPTLEGDDVMGIWATHPALKGDKIIVSIDKDMQTIPGLVYRPGKDKEPRLISEAEADRMHLIQALTGDATDNYKGCPGVGKVNAARIIDKPVLLEPREIKGHTVWLEGPPCSPWDALVSNFAKAGFGPEEALTQARVARICRATDYNSKRKEVILWSPPTAQQ